MIASDGPVSVVTCSSCGVAAVLDLEALVALRPAVLASWAEEKRLLAEQVAEEEAAEVSGVGRPVWSARDS